ILKKSWGEALVGGIGITLFILLLALPGILMLILGVVLLVMGKVAVLGVLLLVLGLLYLLMVSAAGSALQGIFVSALYQYATQGEAPRGFDQSTMAHAFTSK